MPSALAATADLCVQIARDGTNFLDIMDITGVLVRVTGIDTASAAVQTLGDSLSALSFPIGANKIRLRSVNTGSSADVNLVDVPSFRVLLAKD